MEVVSASAKPQALHEGSECVSISKNPRPCMEEETAVHHVEGGVSEASDMPCVMAVTEDCGTAMSRLQQAFQQLDLDEAANLVEKYADKYQNETVGILTQAVSKKQLNFMFINSLQCSETFFMQLFKRAVELKMWRFLSEGYFSNWSELVFRQIITSDVDSVKMFVQELWENTMEFNLEYGNVRFKFFEWLVHVGAFDLLKEVLVTMNLCHESDDNKINGYDDMGSCVGDDEHVIPWLAFKRFCCQRISRASKRTVLQSMSEDGRTPCQYFAVLLASHFCKWGLIKDAILSGKVVLQNGADEVFYQALLRKAWSCAAIVLHAAMNQANTSQSDVILNIENKVDDINRMVHFISLFLKPFLRRCMRMKLYAAGAIVAVWAHKWQAVRQLLTYMQQGTQDCANNIVIGEILRNNRFKLVWEWIRRQPDQSLAQLYIDTIVCEAAESCRYIEARALLETYMDKCRDSVLLREVIYHIILYGLSDLLAKFIAKDLLLYVDDIDYALCKAVDMVQFHSDRILSEWDAMRYKILLQCLEAGCFTIMSKQTQPFSPFLAATNRPVEAAIQRGLVPVMRIFYMMGILTEKVVYDLLQQVHTGSHNIISNLTATTAFLEETVQTPRTLQNWCCITVSPMLGCHADRKQRALSLGLPTLLTRKILFLDVLYPDCLDIDSYHKLN